LKRNEAFIVSFQDIGLDKVDFRLEVSLPFNY